MIRAAAIALLLLTACSDEAPAPAVDAAADANAIPDIFGGGGEIYTSTPDADASSTGCRTHADCGSRFCDRTTGACLDCLVHAHCPATTPVCRLGSCEPASACAPDAPCESGVCGPADICVDCTSDADCGGTCRNEVCRTGLIGCGDASDCAPYAMQCQSTVCVDCLVDAHCALENHCAGGVCQPDVCVPETTAPDCRQEGAAVAQCTQSGSGFEEVYCGDGWRCEPAVGGASQARCAPVICEPGERACADDGAYALCNEWGTSRVTVTCPAGTTCVAGECRPPRPVIVVVFDTSSSMWGYPEGGIPDQCEAQGTTCVPPWPQCEANTDGITLMGRTKLAFSKLFESFAGKAHFMLMRFPQRTFGTATPGCKSGYYAGLTKVEGDPDEHETAPGGWFAQSMGQVALALLPQSAEESNLPQIQQWLDQQEIAEATDVPCAKDVDCAPGFCAPIDGEPGADKRCHHHTNPELRAVGQTPLGRSLFYAGEVLRHTVAVDGRPCVTAADCGTPFHTCDEGLCHDSGRPCRRFVVLLFTDGSESVDTSVDSWFHPRNQAKRLHFGLGCGSDADCLSGATCAGGTCQSAAVSLSAHICADTGAYCQADTDCKGGACVPDESTYVDPLGVQRLEDDAGKPIPVTVSVVTVGYEKGHAASIAGWGGGEAVSVSDASSTILLDELSKLVSAKIQAECVP